MNKVILKGRLTKDIEVTASGKMASCTIAVDRMLKDKDGNKVTDFINLKWLGEKSAHFVNTYFGKGSEILVCGFLGIDKYTDKDGNPRVNASVYVNETDFCGSRQQREADQSAGNDDFMRIPDEFGNDEIPFN